MEDNNVEIKEKESEESLALSKRQKELVDSIQIASTKARMTPKQLADALGISEEDMKELFAGKKMFTVDTLLAIEVVLGTEIFTPNFYFNKRGKPSKNKFYGMLLRM